MIKSFIYSIYDKMSFNQGKYLRILKQLDTLCGDELLNFQLEKIIQCCNSFKREIYSWDDFYQLPITTKQDLPNTPPIKGEYRQHETSGSTGEPRVIYVPKEMWYQKDAIFTRSWQKLGRKNEWVLRLIAGEPHYKFYDSLRNVYPMNYRTIGPSSVDWLLKHKPYLIHGPGGAIRQLCELAIKSGHQNILKDIKIHWCSESSAGHKERLKDFVKEFHEQYGLAEMPTVAATDGLGNLKLVEECCYTEIVDDEGCPVPDGNEGYIVVTDFGNYITPIIRYRSGDRGKIQLVNGYRVLYDIVGRGVDYYDGPQVKRAVGWWVVSPISHTLGHIIDQWRVEIKPLKGFLILYYKGNVSPEHPDFLKYQEWIKENLGLDTLVERSDEIVNYNIYWKNKLVKVTL